MQLPPLAFSAFSMVALSGSTLAQCVLEVLEPSNAYYAVPTGSLANGVVALSGGGMQASVFDLGPTGWTETADFTAPGFVFSLDGTVASDGGTVVVGAPEDDNLLGSAYVYEQSQGFTQPVKLSATLPEAYDTFGAALSLSGDTLAIGSPMSVNDVLCGPGKAFVFERSGADWVQTGAFLPHTFTFGMTGFGFDVSTDGQSIAVGSAWDNEVVDDSGAVYVYARAGNGWVEEAKLFPSNAANAPGLGISVAIEGDTLLAGAVASGIGAVYVFERTPNGWEEQEILSPSDRQAGDQFGFSVALSGDRAAIGASGLDAANANVGGLYAYQRQASGWVQTAKVVAEDADIHARFGANVDLEGDLALMLGVWTQAARVVSLLPASTNYCASTPNSTGSPAVLALAGCASISNGISLQASPVPNEPGIFFYGPTQLQAVLGNGFRCVAAPVTRTTFFQASGNVATWPVADLTVPPHDQISVGSTWNFQAWFRDPQAGGSEFNLSDGMSLTFAP